MAFIDHLDGDSLAGFFFARVAGLPYIFSNVEAPTEWVVGGSGTDLNIALGGEIYTWSVSMLFPDSLATLTQKLAPKAGVATSGSMNFGFAYAGGGTRDPTDDPWLSMLLNNPNRADGRVTTLSDKLSPSSLTLTVINNLFSSGFQQLYIGLETVTSDPSTGTATTIPVIKRGAYGSPIIGRVAVSRDQNVEQQSVGVRVSDFPMSMEGRVIELFFCPADVVPTGKTSLRLRPVGDPDSAEVGTPYTGIITGVSEGGDLLTFELQTTSLQHLLDVPACSFFPEGQPYTATMNENLEVERLYIGPHNDVFHVAVQYNGAAADPFFYIADNAALADNDTLTIGGVLYTFKVAPAPAPALEILIGVDAEDTANQCILTMTLSDLAAGVNVAGGWRAARALGRMVFYTPIAGDPSTITTSTSNTGAITFSGIDGSRDGNIEAFNLPFGTPADTQIPFYKVALVASQLAAQLAPSVGIPGFQVALEWTTENDGKAPKAKLIFSWPGYEQLVSELGGITVKVFPSIGAQESMLRDLGFTKTVEGQSTEEGNIELVADKASALFRWPAPAFNSPERLYFSFPSARSLRDFFGSKEFDSLSTTSGWRDDDNNLLPMVVKLGDKEIVEGPQQTPVIGGNNTAHMSVTDRGTFNGLSPKEIYREMASADKLKAFKAVSMPAFRNTSMERMLLYIMLGGSGEEWSNNKPYDEGWRGAGATIPARLVDVGSFLEYSDLGANKRDNWMIQPGDTLRDVIQGEALVSQQFVVISGGKFTMIDLLPVSEADAISAVSLDQSEINSTTDAGGVGFDRKENRIANLAKTKINYNNASGKFETQVEASQSDSVNTWGEKRAINLLVRGLADVAGAAQLAASTTQLIFNNHAQPNVLIDVSVCSFRAWAWNIGDAVRLTHAMVPSYQAPGRGVVDMPCRVRGIGNNWIGGANPKGAHFSRVTLASDAYSGVRSSEWSPAALLESTGDGGVTWIVKNGEFGPGVSVKDLASFVVGWRVLIAPLADMRRAAATEHTITSIDINLGLLQLAPAFTGATVDSFMWPAAYDDSDTVETQRNRVYWSDGSFTLTSPDGDDASFSYV